MSTNSKFIPVFVLDLLNHEPATLWLKDAKIGTSLPEIKFTADTRQGVKDQMNKMIDSLIEEAAATHSDPVCYVVQRGGIKKRSSGLGEFYYGIYCSMITPRDLACPTLPGNYVLSDTSNGNLEYEHREYPLVLRPTLRPLPKKTRMESGLIPEPIKEQCDMPKRLRTLRLYYIPFEKGVRYELDGKFLPSFSIVQKASKFNSTLFNFVSSACVKDDLDVAYICHRNPMAHTYPNDELIGSFALLLKSENDLLTTLPEGYKLQSDGSYVNETNNCIYPTYYTVKEEDIRSMENFTDYQLAADKIKPKETKFENLPAFEIHRNFNFQVSLNGVVCPGVFAFDKQNEQIEIESYFREDFENVRSLKIEFFDRVGNKWCDPMLFNVTASLHSLCFKVDASVQPPEHATKFKYTYTLN